MLCEISSIKPCDQLTPILHIQSPNSYTPRLLRPNVEQENAVVTIVHFNRTVELIQNITHKDHENS